MSEQIQNVETTEIQNNEIENTEVEKLELTPEELQRKIDSEADRRLDKVLKKKQQEWESELQQRIDEAIKEQQRLSQLSEKERKQEELSKKEQELLKKEQELARKELRSETIEVLQEKELPAKFADFLLAEDAETTLENINAFKEAFDAAVNEAVKEKLRQDTPKAGGSVSGISKEQFNQMTYIEKLELKRNNPAEYQKLVKGD